MLLSASFRRHPQGSRPVAGDRRSQLPAPGPIRPASGPRSRPVQEEGLRPQVLVVGIQELPQVRHGWNQTFMSTSRTGLSLGEEIRVFHERAVSGLVIDVATVRLRSNFHDHEPPIAAWVIRQTVLVIRRADDDRTAEHGLGVSAVGQPDGPVVWPTQERLQAFQLGARRTRHLRSLDNHAALERLGPRLRIGCQVEAVGEPLGRLRWQRQPKCG